jgi:hypothetical protein
LYQHERRSMTPGKKPASMMPRKNCDGQIEAVMPVQKSLTLNATIPPSELTPLAPIDIAPCTR